MEADFRGYATRAGVKCSDGRTILPDAFKHQDQTQVPLVWQHGHSDLDNVLGHVLLENRPDGVYAHGFFNDGPKAEHAKRLVAHRDVKSLSIWANELREQGGRVMHGMIREVSLVLAGANPGAFIDTITIRHSDGSTTEVDDEALIYSGLDLELLHADGATDEADTTDAGEDEETVQDVYDSMTDKQKQVLHFMLGQALQSADGEIQQSNIDNEEKGSQMTRNVFEKDADPQKGAVLSHDAVKGIVADAARIGSLKEAVNAYALAHGIDNIDLLFPDAKAVSDTPEWITRRMEWVSGVIGGARKSPFSRIKTLSADLTYDEARAKGYIKGTMKKEEFFAIAKRVTTPTTIYKKQKLDRDDIIDITDFNVVTWLKSEMRLMLDEEIARAVLIGDGRDVSDDDKIVETNIRPIAKDDPFFTVDVPVNLGDANSSVTEIIDAIILARQYYKGSGLPTFYTSESYIAQFMLLKDTLGRRLYANLSELAAELRVAAIVPVEVMEDEPLLVGVIVNMNDYVIGADRGGEISMFDDFDIDYNQYKYLIETRMSGALVKAKSAMVVRRLAAADSTDTPVTVVPPEWDGVSKITIPTVVGLVYKDKTGATLDPLTDNPVTLASGASETITVSADAAHYLRPSARTSWTYTNRS